MRSLYDYARHGIKVKDKTNTLHNLMRKHVHRKRYHEVMGLDTNVSIPKVHRGTVPDGVKEKPTPAKQAAAMPVRPGAISRHEDTHVKPAHVTAPGGHSRRKG